MFCKINSKWTLQQMLTKIEHIKHIAFCSVSNRNTQCTFNPNKTIDHMILTFQPKFCQKILQLTKIQKLTFLLDVCISFSNVVVLSLDLPRLSQLKNICCCCCCAYCCSLHTRIDITGQGSRLRFSLLRRSLAKKVKAPPRGRSCSRQVASSGKLWFSVTLLLGYHHAYHVLVLTNCKENVQ